MMFLMAQKQSQDRIFWSSSYPRICSLSILSLSFFFLLTFDQYLLIASPSRMCFALAFSLVLLCLHFSRYCSFSFSKTDNIIFLSFLSSLSLLISTSFCLISQICLSMRSITIFTLSLACFVCAPSLAARIRTMRLCASSLVAMR